MRPDLALNGVVGRYVRKQSIRKGRQITAFPRTWIMIGPSHLGRPSRAKHTMLSWRVFGRFKGELVASMASRTVDI